MMEDEGWRTLVRVPERDAKESGAVQRFLSNVTENVRYRERSAMSNQEMR
jgi:hypothetical protein